MQFKKHPVNPIVPVARWTWRDEEVSAPCLVVLDDRALIYHSARMGSKDRIGVAVAPIKPQFDAQDTSEIGIPNPLLDAGAPGAPDELGVRHPSVVVRDGMWYCFYTGISAAWTPAICAATSLDGIEWNRYVRNPLFLGDDPEVIIRDSSFELFFTQKCGDGGGSAIFRASSLDAVRWTVAPEPALVPAQRAWDSYSLTSPRILQHDNVYYMFYGGDSEFCDYPRGIGVAASHDLATWQRLPDSPVLAPGTAGEWDDGAVWPGGAQLISGNLMLLYEGCGKGAHGAEKGPPIYSPSQIGCAFTSPANLHL